MGVTYLLMNQGSAAKEVFEAVLQQWPDDGFAQVSEMCQNRVQHKGLPWSCCELCQRHKSNKCLVMHV